MRNQPLLWDYFEMLQLFIVYDAENSFERQTTCLEKIHTMKRRGGLSRTEYACHLSECVLWEIDQVKNIDIAVVVELNKNFILHAEDVVSHDSFHHTRIWDFMFFFTFSEQGQIQGGEGGAPGMRAPLKLEKIWFFGVKSWFFTRNTPKMFEPPSAWHNFFKCVPPPTWNPGSAPAELSQIKNYRCHCGLWNWKKLHSTSRRCGLSWQLSSYKNMSVIFFFLIWVLQVWPSQNLLMSLWFVELKKKNSASRRCGQSWQVFFTV